MTTQTLQTSGTAGGRLVAPDGRILPLRGMRLAARAGGGLARTRVEQRFANPHAEPLRVTYLLPLPADAAVVSFAFTIGERRVVGEIEPRAAARERFEQALAEGRSAALLEQERSSLFTQELGNVPPGAEVVAELEVDQPLAWLARADAAADETGGAWEWRFPTTVAPRYLGAEGRVEDAEHVSVDVTEAAVAPRLTIALDVLDALAQGIAPVSPSHRLCTEAFEGVAHAAFEDAAGARLDRDVVVRWSVAAPEVGARLETARASADRTHSREAHGLLTLVPPAWPGTEVLSRDLIVLLDTSGSMHGEPLEQAKAVVRTLIEGLTERDRLELVAFALRPDRWRRRAVSMTAAARAAALRWLDELRAGGGTEMADAVIEALRPLDGASQRQVLLVTDGFVGFEQQIVAEVLRRLPGASRLHTLGVGSAPNRSLTSAAARAGRGVEAIVGPGEDPDEAAALLVAALEAPRVVELELAGDALVDHAPRRLPDLLDGAPARIALALRAEGGELVVRGRTAEGRWEQRLVVGATAPGAGRGEVVSLHGRERVEDLESELAGGADQEAVDAEVEALGLAYGLATRRTSWVAVSSEQDVDPGAPARRERIPHELAQGLSAEGLGLREVSTPSLAPMSFLASSPLDDTADLAVLGLALPPAQERFEYQHAESLVPPDRSRRARSRRRRLAGRVRSLADGRLSIELDSDGIDWVLPLEVRLVWRRRRERMAVVDTPASTRPGRVEAGLTVRVVLELPEGAPEGLPVLLLLELDGETIQVRLS